jgi:hypothetical protein
MNDPSARGPRGADPHPRLRVTALAAVIIGVVLLAAAAFVLSYAGIHQIALAAGVPPALARLYPLIFDAMLVVASAAALALRGAGWWTRCYVWLSLLLLLAAVAAGDAVRAMGQSLPHRPAAGAVAVLPWVLVLLAFGLLLAMLRQLRRARSGSAGPGAGNGTGNGDRAAARPGLDALLDPRPAVAAPSLDDRLVAGDPAAVAAGPHELAGLAAGYQHEGAGEEADAYENLAGGGEDDPAADYGEPETATAGHDGQDGHPEHTGQPLSAPPPAHLDRPRSSPTRPEEQDTP